MFAFVHMHELVVWFVAVTQGNAVKDCLKRKRPSEWVDHELDRDQNTQEVKTLSKQQIIIMHFSGLCQLQQAWHTLQ